MGARAARISLELKLATLASACRVYLNKQFRLCGKELLSTQTTPTDARQLQGNMGITASETGGLDRMRSDTAAIPRWEGTKSRRTWWPRRRSRRARTGKRRVKGEVGRLNKHRKTSPSSTACRKAELQSTSVPWPSTSTAGQALSEAGRRLMAERDALVAARNERAPGTLRNGWRAQGTVEVQLRNIEVYRDCLVWRVTLAKTRTQRVKSAISWVSPQACSREANLCHIFLSQLVRDRRSRNHSKELSVWCAATDTSKNSAEGARRSQR